MFRSHSIIIYSFIKTWQNASEQLNDLHHSFTPVLKLTCLRRRIYERWTWWTQFSTRCGAAGPWPVIPICLDPVQYNCGGAGPWPVIHFSFTFRSLAIPCFSEFVAPKFVGAHFGVRTYCIGYTSFKTNKCSQSKTLLNSAVPVSQMLSSTYSSSHSTLTVCDFAVGLLS